MMMMMMDYGLFATSSIVVTLFLTSRSWKKRSNICLVNEDNEEIVFLTTRQPKDSNYTSSSSSGGWYRATYILIVHEPPHMFYEPREWNHTNILLVRREINNSSSRDDSNDPHEQQPSSPQHQELYALPGRPVWSGESYVESAINSLKEDYHIRVDVPENCLHHLFTFPYETRDDKYSGSTVSFASPMMKNVWGAFYECVFRGELSPGMLENLEVISLAETKELLEDTNAKDNARNLHHQPLFTSDTRHALRLYFQRQKELTAKRRLLKGYSSADLQHYGLRPSSSLAVLRREDSTPDSLDRRNEGMEYTMKTDDGMSPHLLYKADVVLLGVSRAGKTPLSIYMAQTMGLKVANIPLVLELEPPRSLSSVDSRRVFCLTLQPEFLQKFRVSRFSSGERKQKNASNGSSFSAGGFRGLYGKSKKMVYSESEYVERDLQHARSLARENGYTEIDVTGRAIEETANMIVSKLKERYPEAYITL